jgi:DNA-directed RNA polymerase sigma subunit (sigma70/sigma32)
MSSIQGVVLSSVEQYRSEVLRLPRLTRSEESELVYRARQGDKQAKDELVHSCLRYVCVVASRYVCYVQHEEYLDLVSIGNLAVVECLEKALSVANPVAYLYGVARLAIKSYCYTHSQLITQQRGKPFVWVDSLEAPIGTSQGCLADRLIAPALEPQKQPADFASLYEAISALTPKQRYVVLRSFGLDGDAPEPIAAINQRLATTNPNGMLARNRYNLAIRSLRRKLLQSA